MRNKKSKKYARVGKNDHIKAFDNPMLNNRIDFLNLSIRKQYILSGVIMTKDEDQFNEEVTCRDVHNFYYGFPNAKAIVPANNLLTPSFIYVKP
jgi:hypothetical protein